MQATEPKTPLILPFLRPFYDHTAGPLAYLGLRVVVGGLLVLEGWPKIMAPFGMAGFVEGIGLHPGWFWSAVLAVMQFAGGILILIGFLTRPAALANAIVLAVTLWFHATHPYGTVFLSPEGLDALAVNQPLFSADGLRNLGTDGGSGFLHQVQFKAEGFSALWSMAAFFLAAFGAGPLSVDRSLLHREF